MQSVMTGSGSGDDEVVLTGLSGRLPESGSIEEFAQQLFDGVDLVTSDDRRWRPGMYGLPKRSGKLKDLAHFDAMFFGVSAKQANVMDPQVRLLLELTHEVIVDAGFNPTEFRGSRTGVYVGVSSSESEEELCRGNGDNVNGYALMGCCRAMFPNRVSHAFDLKGPSYAIDSACSSSMVAFVQATNAIRAGLCDAAIVAGTNLCIKPIVALCFQQIGALSSDGRCASFDASASGYVRSEAVVAVLLQRRRDARRLYCTVRGARMNNDGYKDQGFTYPSRDLQRRLAQETIDEAGLRSQDIVYVEAHGTGTKVGDPEEVNAIADLFCRDRVTPLLLGSVKSNMGHPEPASGMCSVAKVILAMERGVIPANLHFEKPNPDIPALNDGRIKVVDKNTPWQGGIVGINSSGFGGANAHVILESHKGERPPPVEYPAPRLVLASGRTNEAVEKLLSLAVEHQRDGELHALIDAVHEHEIPGHPRRGFTVLDPSQSTAPHTEVLEIESEPRPVWFVFSGMGSQWPGMARDLLRLPVFAASIARSAVALKPYDIDLHYIIAKAPKAALENVINCFVSISAVQVAMVDVLREIGVRPDGIIGHSLGEIGCAYADETLTAEQTVLCAYWRGRCTLDAKPMPGAMAAVGLSWEEAERRCPEDIELACHNSADNVTISGPVASIEKFIAELSSEGIFTKHVITSNVAFHSRYIADAAPLMLAALQKVIPEPKSRSKRWLSSSVPQDLWETDKGKLSDAAYQVNNLMSPVRFASVIPMVPERALVLEIAPHALLQVVLKRTLPQAVHVPLVHRNAPDALTHLLSAVGKAYTAGAQPQVSRLYPAVAWPVSRGTPALASHVCWDHSIEWKVADYKMTRRTGENIIEYDLRKSEDAFIDKHDIDGRILFPASGYLLLVWRTLAKLNNLEIEEAAVELENVQFRRATIMPRDAPVRFCVRLLDCTGSFEISEGKIAVVTGTARLTDDVTAKRLRVRLESTALDEAVEKPGELLPLYSEDIYKSLRLRGYNYKGVFRGIKSSDARCTSGTLNWEGNWITFLDAMLQFSIIGNTQGLYIPTGLRRVVVDPAAQREAVAAAMANDGYPETSIPIKYYRNVGVLSSGGVEIRGVSCSLTPRRSNIQAAPKLEKHVFLPLKSAHFGSNDNECSTAEQAFTTIMQLAKENISVLQLKLAEPALHQPVESLLLPRALKVLEGEPGVLASGTLFAGGDAPQYAAAMDALGIDVSDKDAARGLQEDAPHIVLGVNVLKSHGAELLATLAAACGKSGFVLLQEPVHGFHEPATQALIQGARLTLISHTRTTLCDYLLLRCTVNVPATRVVVEVHEDDCGWVEQLKEAMKRAEVEDMRVYVWSRETSSGVQGLARCVRHEAGGDRLRVYYLPQAKDAFDPNAPAYKEQLQRDLFFNVLRDGVWGTYRHLVLDDTSEAQIKMEHAYVNTLTRGDLSSLRWIESDLQHAAAAPQQRRTDLCHVYYAPLNFHDILLATGKLPPDSPTEKDCVLGIEFSGRSSSGKRVMGMVPAKGLATTVVADKDFIWEVPKQWSLEQAATVPVAYATAYYALVVRGRMRRGETVLVHAGAGGVGLAAITIALHANCTIFTTVGTPEKRAFLRERFPQLPDAHIGNSRDCSFEELVLSHTCGRGVNLVLNSLAGDKLLASVRCLAMGGRFLEIGKLDLSANTPLGMEILLKNTSVEGIMLDALFDTDSDHFEKSQVVQCVNEGIATGAVKPLPTTVFADNRLEHAFRYMATGKHIGKVLICVREEEISDKLAPAQFLSALPRTYMHPDKSYVLVGGLGGFGLEVGTWMADRGAQTLVLNSRNGVRTGYQAWCVRRWTERGLRVIISTTDVTSVAGARALLQEAAAAAPIGGIFNLAVVLQDAFLENQTPESFRVAAKPKIDGTRALDVASREMAPELDYFVTFSSVVSGRGNPGQSNYGLANSATERLCEQRHTDGLPALAVQWGAVGDVGLAVATYGDDDIEVGGTVPQCIAFCLDTLGVLLRLPHTVVSSFVVPNKRRAQKKPTQDLVQTVANILGIVDLSKLPENTTLTELGMDSLMNTEIKQTLERGYDVIMSVSEIRALTFAKLRSIKGGDSSTKPLAVSDNCKIALSNVNDNIAQHPKFVELVPKQVLLKLPSLPADGPDQNPVFMVHPLEGIVDVLRGVAAGVRGPVYGVQCVSSAPLDDMAALARFYVKHIRALQPLPPYTLLGYSFGAGAAFEMALQLEQDGCETQLILVDGSPTFLSLLASRLKEMQLRVGRSQQYNEADALACFATLLFDMNPIEVLDGLQQLPDWEMRVDRLTELIVASGANVDKEAIASAARSFYGRLMLCDTYKPSGRLRAPVTLFKAIEKPMEVEAGLQELCETKLRVHSLTGTHQTILTGDSARVISDHVSQLLAQQ